MKKKTKMFSLKRQIIGAVWFFIIVVALLLITFLISTISSYQKRADEKRTKDMVSYAETLDGNLAELLNATGEIYSANNDFNEINLYPTPARKWNHVYNLLNVLRIQVKSNKGIAGMFLYCDSFDWVQYAVDDKVSFRAKEELKKTGKAELKNSNKVFVSFIQSVEADVWYNVYMKKASAAIGGCIRLSQGLPDERDEEGIYGVISEEKFHTVWTADGTDGEAPEKKLSSDVVRMLSPGKNHVDGKVVYLHQLNSADMSVVEILPESIWLYIGKIHVFLIVLIILYIIAAFRLQKFVYAELSSPLEDMTKALMDIHAGVWKVNFSAPNRISEIEDVRQSVKMLLTEIEHYKIRFYEDELEKAKIHRQYLQLQLAPHFYTNCLKNAYYMLALKEYGNAENFLQRLSVHLRYLLQKDTPLVKVEQEMEFVRNYLDLQKLMTNKPLSARITVDDEAREKDIPILGIQTFVENSVKYGRRAGESKLPLEIEISVKLRKTEEGNYLDMTVRDNGHGYPRELLDVINEKNPTEKEGLGVGVINLQKRIRIFYGDCASWYFENQNGAVSELILPERKDEQK